MTTPIPASELTPGMTITACKTQPGLVGWKVTDKMHGYAWAMGPSRDCDIVLLTLERYHPPAWDTDTGGTVARLRQTRTAWLRADEQVEVET